MLIGDVVGLGKTLMATAVARIFEDDHDLETLDPLPQEPGPDVGGLPRRSTGCAPRCCPSAAATSELPNLRRYRLVLIDESHNLRNREGKRYRVIQDYIREERKQGDPALGHAVQQDLPRPGQPAAALRSRRRDLGIRPENLLREIGETEFIRRHQCAVRSLAAFEKSEYADDWRELMRLYMVRRTRTFIQDNYADDRSGERAQVSDLRGRHAVLLP